MNNLTFKGDWNIVKGKLKQKYAQLTDDDLQYVKGQEDELIGRIQKRTGVAKNHIIIALAEFGGDLHSEGNRVGRGRMN